MVEKGSDLSEDSKSTFLSVIARSRFSGDDAIPCLQDIAHRNGIATPP